MITVVGLGVNEGQLTLRGAEVIKNAELVLIKTALTPTYNFFKDNGVEAEALDRFFEEAEDFSDLDYKLADYITEKAAGKNLVFAVNGNGSDDSTVVLLKQTATVKIIAGVSAADEALSYAPATSSSAYSASDVAGKAVFTPDKRVPLVVTEVDNRMMASEIKLKLMDAYGDDAPLFVITDGRAQLTTLAECDRAKSYNHTTAFNIPPVDLLNAERYDFADLLQIMARLLGDNGCPWDRAQTHDSIRSNLIEEAYELVEAINNDDVENMREETGDVLLQAVFHALIGELEGEYNMADALTELCKKLVSRHTHIFGTNTAVDADSALASWEAAKKVEKHNETAADKMDRLPKVLPALTYALKVQKYAAKEGFEWQDKSAAYDKITEEVEEFKAADGTDAEMEAGDVLFAAINPIRHRKIDPELALRRASEKFVNRYKYVSQRLAETGGDINDVELFDRIWAEAKKLYK